MKFESVRVVLVETTHPGNIGSTARALKTMGFAQLYLVNPKIYPDKRAIDMSAGADDVLENAVVTNTLDEAIAGCQLVIGTSARPRGLSLPGLLPEDSANLISKQKDNVSVALVFGREHAGLTNGELLHCNYHLNIPSNPDYSSLNLAQAVQIVLYQLRVALIEPKVDVKSSSDPLANTEDIQRFYEHFEEVLKDIEFIKPSTSTKLFLRIKRLFNRVQLEETEVRLLRGILSQVQNTIKYGNNKEY